MTQRTPKAELMSLFGRRLRDARGRRGFTQDTLATEIGMSVDMISRMERGKAPPSFETVTLLCTALEVDASYLFGGDEDRLPASEGVRELLDRIRGLSDVDVKRVRTALDLILR